MDDWNWVSRLLHFSDSALPVGAYAHSFGLEGVCQMGVVHDSESLDLFLKRDVSHALRTIDLPLLVHAHAAAMDGVVEEIARLDQVSWALRPTRQLREAASKIGRQQWLLYQRTWNESVTVTLPHYQSPIVLGIISANEGIPVNAALSSLAYQTFSALLQAALKLLPLGPRATQQLLHGALEALSKHLDSATQTPEDEIGSFNPIWDIGASQHESADARLFIS